MIDTSVDKEGRKRGDPRWQLVKVKDPNHPKIKEKLHIKDLERIDVSETESSINATFTFLHMKPQRVYCQKSERSRFIEVLWWIIQTAKYFFQTVPATNLNRREIESLTNEWTAITQEMLDSADDGPGAMESLMAQTQRSILKMLHQDSQREEEKTKEKPTNYQVEVNISPEEAETIEAFLKSSGLGVEDIHMLEDHLTTQLTELENLNIQALFSERNIKTTENITRQIGEIMKLVDEMAKWMSFYEDSLGNMRKGVKKIERQNKKLKIQEQSHEKLQKTLSELLNVLDLKVFTSRNLKHPDFTRLQEMLDSAHQLNRTMSVQLKSLESMRAVKQKRAMHAELADRFTTDAAKYLADQFHHISSERVSKIRSSGIQGKKGDISESESHKMLKKFREMVRLLARMNRRAFEGLKDKYISNFKKVYETKLKTYFQILKKRLAAASVHVDSRMSSFPDYNPKDTGYEPRSRSRVDSSMVSHLQVRGDRDGKSRVGGTAATSFAYDAPSTGSATPQTTRSRATSERNIMGSARLGENRESKNRNLFTLALSVICPLVRAEQDFLESFFFFDAAEDGGADAKAADGQRGGAGGDEKGGGGTAPAAMPRKLSITSNSLLTTAKSYPCAKSMLEELLKGAIPGYLQTLAQKEDAKDHFGTLKMLMELQRAKEANDDIPYLAYSLTQLDTELRMMFNKFIDGEVQWIKGKKAAAKATGVLTPLLKFPSFSNKIEMVLDEDGADIQVAVLAYHKLSNALFALVKETASEDAKKHGRRVLIENFHFFWKAFDSRMPQIAALQTKVEEAHAMYMQNLKEYVEWHVQYEMPKLTQFWDKLDQKLVNNNADELQFMVPKQEVVSTMKKTLPGLKKNIENVYKRLMKHMPENHDLRHEVWRALQAYFMDRFKRFESQVTQCYHNLKKLAVTVSDAEVMFATVMMGGGLS